MSTTKAPDPIKFVDISGEDFMEWTEDQLREDFARRGWDYDAMTDRGVALVQQLSAEHEARAARRKAGQS